MPITRSKGRAATPSEAEAQAEDVATRGPMRHHQPPRSPSSTSEPAPVPSAARPAPLPARPAGAPSATASARPAPRYSGAPSDRAARPAPHPAAPAQAATPAPRTAHSSTPRRLRDTASDVTESSRRRATGSDHTLRQDTASVAPWSLEDENSDRREPKEQDRRSTTTRRSNRNVLKAREEMLRIRLELAQIALQKAEEDADSDYEDDGQSRREYVRSWLEEGPQPIGPIEAGVGQDNDLAAALPAEGDTEGAQKIEPNREDEDSTHHKNLHQQGGDSLKPFINELTSAIAALADRKPQEASTVHQRHPSVSKVIMTLPSFNGAHTEWLSFRAIYDTTKGYFNDVENTARLRRSLKGRALETVSSELIGHARPDDIMRELELQFGRPDSIAQAETDKLRTLPRCTEAPKDICSFASKIRSGVVTLQALKKDHYLINAELLRVLTEKLPNSLRVQWYRVYTEKHQSKPDLSSFSEFVTEYARYCSAFAPAEDIKGEYQPYRRVSHRTHTATEKPAEVRRATSRCKICDREGHHTSECSKFRDADVNTRWTLAKKHGLCFRCLRTRRHGHTCKSRKCGTGGCTATHNQLLHYEKNSEAPRIEKDQKEVVTNSSVHTARSQAFLKIVPVQIVGPAGEASTFALLDDGSTVSLLDEEIANQVGLKGKPEPFIVRTIRDTSMDMPNSRRVEFQLKNRDGKQTQLCARTVPDLHLSPQGVSKEDLADCKHLQDITDKLTYSTGVPKLLIGQDNWHLLIASSIRRGPKNQPVASLTTLGWVLHGARSRTLGSCVHFVNSVNTSDETIEKQLRDYFALESLIINPRRPSTDPEKRAQDILEKKTVQLPDGHIETGLLWKKEDIVMPDSYENAMKRLFMIEKKLDRNTELKARYTEQIDSLIEKGYAEEAPTDGKPGTTWYLPHFDVHNPMKPEKLRIVHDAAAKSKGVSLNDCLLTGPDLLQSLPGVLMRFRRHSVAVSADIAEMFMQVRVRHEDRDALRYLWRGDRREGAPREYRMKSIIFGAASSPCTAIFAKNWNASKYKSEYPEAVEAIIDNHYMDDYLDSFRSEQEAVRIASQVRDIHRKAQLILRKWVSSSTNVIEQLEPSQRPQESISLAGKGTEEKILGLMWEPTSDTLSFNLKLARLPDGLLNKEAITKREALRIVMSLYDPLGLASPVTIRAKQILQEAWRLGTGWDEQLQSELGKQWTSWIHHLQQLKIVSVPRCYPGFSEATSLQVHVFTDASESAYAAAVYWRTVTSDGRVCVTLAMAKARVAPVKITSIPRLELQAAVMGSRLASGVIEEHRVKPESTTYWTDSKTVLTWITKGSRSFKPFVAHRLAAIEECTKVREWRWVPTKQNIADAATRDVPINFNSEHEWFTGPSFLYEDSSLWPIEKIAMDTETGEEKIASIIESCNTQDRKYRIAEAVPDVNRFSKWERLLRSTARVLQFIALCRRNRSQVLYKRTIKRADKDPDWRHTRKSENIKSGRVTPNPVADSRNFVLLTAEHIRGAEDLLVKAVQGDSFDADLRELRRGEGVTADSRLRPLAVELHNGIITLRSRIVSTDNIAERTKRPPILDGEHRITQLYIDWTHRSLHHSGTELVINEIRQHYWVLRLRPTAKKIVHDCLQCRIRKSQPPEPATGDHPKARLAHHQRPFSFTGLDYFGPLSVTVGRQHQKRYVALFTCLTSRAVHLEVAASLSADSAILALRRFAARRGCPTEIYSDNGTNMHGADREMREAVKNEANRRGIVWRFITPSAPFMGGAWERLVRCVKSSLYTVLHEKHPHEEVLTTLLCEVEYTVNSRPLTHVSVDPEDDEAITPNHILFGGSTRLPSLGEFNESDVDSRKHWRRAQALADAFWHRWVREYLPELQHRREPHSTGPLFAVGDPVLIADGQLPRNTWPRGRIIAVYPGADGQIRTVEVRTAAGVLKRPTKKLVPLPK